MYQKQISKNQEPQVFAHPIVEKGLLVTRVGGDRFAIAKTSEVGEISTVAARPSQLNIESITRAEREVPILSIQAVGENTIIPNNIVLEEWIIAPAMAIKLVFTGDLTATYAYGQIISLSGVGGFTEDVNKTYLIQEVEFTGSETYLWCVNTVSGLDLSSTGTWDTLGTVIIFDKIYLKIDSDYPISLLTLIDIDSPWLSCVSGYINAFLSDDVIELRPDNIDYFYPALFSPANIVINDLIRIYIVENLSDDYFLSDLRMGISVINGANKTYFLTEESVYVYSINKEDNYIDFLPNVYYLTSGITYDTGLRIYDYSTILPAPLYVTGETVELLTKGSNKIQRFRTIASAYGISQAGDRINIYARDEQYKQSLIIDKDVHFDIEDGAVLFSDVGSFDSVLQGGGVFEFKNSRPFITGKGNFLVNAGLNVGNCISVTNSDNILRETIIELKNAEIISTGSVTANFKGFCVFVKDTNSQQVSIDVKNLTALKGGALYVKTGNPTYAHDVQFNDLKGGASIFFISGNARVKGNLIQKVTINSGHSFIYNSQTVGSRCYANVNKISHLFGNASSNEVVTLEQESGDPSIDKELYLTFDTIEYLSANHTDPTANTNHSPCCKTIYGGMFLKGRKILSEESDPAISYESFGYGSVEVDEITSSFGSALRAGTYQYLVPNPYPQTNVIVKNSKLIANSAVGVITVGKLNAFPDLRLENVYAINNNATADSDVISIGEIMSGNLVISDSMLICGHASGKYIDKELLSITGITKAASAVISFATAHGLKVGQLVRITSVSGMTEINNQTALISAVTTLTITVAIDTSTGYSTYTSGGFLSTFPDVIYKKPNYTNTANVSAFFTATENTTTGINVRTTLE